VAILNPEHLFEQADKLIVPVVSRPAGPPRQVDLRRAISSAYYGVFHAMLAAAANRFIGSTKQSSSQYSLVYRSVDHAALRRLCLEVKNPRLSPRYTPHAPLGGFGSDIQAFAATVLDLQEKRHAADYDPSIRIKSSDALLVVNAARTALRRFEAASVDAQEAFLSLLLFQPR
jgi:uncharacterized protein (UPF0332 family)